MVVHCVGHCLNNVLQIVFYQAETTKAKKEVAFGEYYLDIIEDEDDQVSESGSEGDEEQHTDDDLKLIDKRNRSINNTSTTSNRNNATATLAQLPPDAKRILVIIIHCKNLVKLNILRRYIHILMPL